MQTGPGVTVTVKREKLLQALAELVQGLVELPMLTGVSTLDFSLPRFNPHIARSLRHIDD